MRDWSITLHGGTGILRSTGTGDSEFVLGTEPGPNVLTIAGEGVAPRHVWLSVDEDGVQVEAFAPETLVNGERIEGRVRVTAPATVRIGTVTMEIESKSGTLPKPILAAPTENTAHSCHAESDVETTMAFGMETQAFLTGASFRVGTEYAKQAEIGRGGMARIVSAKEVQLERVVAVKISTADTKEGEVQFLHEAEVLAKLAHPNIVPIHARGTDDLGRAFYSMKLVKGQTLQAIIRKLETGDAELLWEHSVQRLLEIFRKVCDAVEFAHSTGYLHRDLKPENVMVGEFGEVLVMDWGLAKPIRKVALESGNDQQAEPEKLSYIEGTPQYMSPEQAAGVYGGLDERSDIYSLGAVLYAMLTWTAPVSGASLLEILEKVRTGELTPFETAVQKSAAARVSSVIPKALQAIALKAMSTDRSKRYASVGALIADIESFQDGFLTSAEEASFSRQIMLWVGRNQVLAVSALLLLIVTTFSTARIVQKGREASSSLRSLRETAPTFAVRARDALQGGDFDEALRAATFAVKLEPGNADFHALRGNSLQVLSRWKEAVKEYQAALNIDASHHAKENLRITKGLIEQASSDGEAKAKATLFEALNAQGRQYEAMAFSKELADFWKDRKKDLKAIPKLVKRLEEKMLPVPGTDILLSKTELTVGEWKLYLLAEGLPNWTQPSKEFRQDDEHPVLMVSWNQASIFCRWLSEKTGKSWRLPTNAEWETAVGTSKYPWGDYYPPQWNDGNYAVGADGNEDPLKFGVDGIMGTAPVASFKSNALGFYDLGGNATEWMGDEGDKKTGGRITRGGNWQNSLVFCTVANRYSRTPESYSNNCGFRVALSLAPSERR